jgi:hypothetical protein
MKTPTLVSIRCKNHSNRSLKDYHQTGAVPLAQGLLRSITGLALRQTDGGLIPVQAQATERWADGSIKWLVLDFIADFRPNQTVVLDLIRASRVPVLKPMSWRKTAGTFEVGNGLFTIRGNAKRFSLFERYEAGGKNLVLPGSDIIVEDLAGKRYFASLSRQVKVRLVTRGPIRTVVEVEGRHTAEDDSQMFAFRVRYTLCAKDSSCRIAYKFTNCESPETGVKLASIRLVIPTALGERTTKWVRQCAHGQDWFPRPVEIRETVELIAGKAVNEAARTRYGAAADGKILIRNMDSLQESMASYPYYLRPGNARTDMTGGLRQMYPYLGANGTGGSLVGWFCEMENHYPKAIQMDRHILSYDIWPASFGDLQVRRGQSKEHDLYLDLSPDRRSFKALEATYLDHEVVGFGMGANGASPVTLTLDPAYVRDCQVLRLHQWLPYDEDRYVKMEAKLGSIGPASPPARGMFDSGDGSNPDRSWCHNNENDLLLWHVKEYFRRAEPSQWMAALAKARHNAHVDFIACDPHPLRQGTMPAHCPEHTDGATYPSHMWVGGLLAAYCLTGESDFRDAALSVGANMRRWQEAKTIFYCDSRECGWPMLAYLQLFEHTQDRKWLKYAHEVFEFYRDHMTSKGEILYEIPHGMGTFKLGYGEFITWRACYFYYEITGLKEVKNFLVRALRQVYRYPAQRAFTAGGWGCNDFFPSWALYKLTGDEQVLKDNLPFLDALMEKPGGFPWGGDDMHFYLAEIEKLGWLERICKVAPEQSGKEQSP